MPEQTPDGMIYDIVEALMPEGADEAKAGAREYLHLRMRVYYGTLWRSDPVAKRWLRGELNTVQDGRATRLI